MFQNSPGALLFLFPKHGFSLRGYAVIPGCRTDLAALLPGTRVAVRTSPGGTKNTAVSRPVPRVLPADATKIFSIQNHQFLKVKRRLPRAFSFSREIGTDQVNFPGSGRKRPGHSPRRPLFPACSGLPASPAVWFPRVSCLTANIINYIFRCYSPLYENDQSPEHRWPCERKGSPRSPGRSGCSGTQGRLCTGMKACSFPGARTGPDHRDTTGTANRLQWPRISPGAADRSVFQPCPVL